MKNKFKSLYWFLILIIFLECVYKISIFKTFFSWDTLLLLLFSMPIVILFYIITSLFKEKINKILVFILSLIITIIFIAQIVYFNFYQSMFSVFSVMNGTTQVMQFAQDILNIMLGIWYIILICLIPLVLFIIFNKKVFSFKQLKLKKALIWFCAMLIFYSSQLLLIKFDDESPSSLNWLYSGTHAPMVTAKKVGLLTMTRYDLVRFIFGFEEKVWINDIEEEKEEEPEEIIIKYNELDIDFDSLILNESNSKIKSMHEYFKNTPSTSQNEFTGMFKDKNLIFITAEGFDTLAIDETLTPTLYKLANNGFIFKNFYQPLFPVSTSDGEYMNVMSLIPKEGVWSLYQSSKNYMPFAIGNMFKKLGYKTMAYHNHSYKYYNRDKSHPNMGFKYIGCGNGLQKKMKCGIWPESDYEMMKATFSDYKYTKEQELASKTIEEMSSMIEGMAETKKIQKFATYYMTVSGHLNYSKSGNNMARRNWDAVKNLPYSEAIKAYIACNIEFEKAMKYLLDSLEEAGILDDTVIVISPDHYPYGLKNERKEMSEILGIDKLDKFENYRTSLIIYNSDMENIEINKYASSIDILPTVYNLFGLEFDSRLLMGRDILSSDEEGLIILSDRSWITDKGTYNSIKGKFTPYNEDENVTEEYIDMVNQKVQERFSMSTLILTYDYYNHLGLK